MTLARILGYLIVLFFLLASTNGLKKYTSNKLVKKVASNHKLFGMLATITAFVHLVVNVSNNNLRPFGLITLLLLLATGALGASFYKLKNKKLYIAHRILGPITLLSIIIHVLTNLL